MAPNRERITFLVFVGHACASAVEEMVALAKEAAALDTIERLLELDTRPDIIVATNSLSFAAVVARLPVTVDIDEGEFHFGRRLGQLIHKYSIEHPFYIGGGSLPLLSTAEIAQISHQVLSVDAVVVTNNLYSSDLVAFSPGVAIDRISPPLTDNNLAYALHHEAGLPSRPLPRSVSMLMDLDTPTDLTILQTHPNVGRHVLAFVRKLNLDTRNIDAVVSVMNDPSRQLLVAGRVSADVWAYVEKNTACQTRVLAEERGMRASGRDLSGQVRSLMGFLIEERGPRGFFEALGEMADAALIDSRVIFHHFGRSLPASDRFNCDLLRPEEIKDAFAREFAAAAREAPMPVVLGGHTVVAGGLLAVVDAALARRSATVREQR